MLLALACTAVAAGPLLQGRGIDTADTAVYYTLSSWEWLHHAITQGVSPWFVPGKLGGVSLYSDTVPMAPFYPAAGLLYVLPAGQALAVSALLHALGTVLTVRWLARVHGVSARSAALAGAAVAVGPLGAALFIDLQLEVLPILLWFPLLLGADARLAEASSRAERVRWAATAAGAGGLMLLGGELRWGAGAMLAWLLVAGLRRQGLGRALVAWLAALAAGAAAWLPALLEIRTSGTLIPTLQSLGLPQAERFGPEHFGGWLAPKPFWYDRDLSLGAILGLCFLLALPALRGPLRRLAACGMLLLLLAAGAGVPGLRVLLAPLLLPVDPEGLVYGSLGLVLAAVGAAAGLDGLLAAEPGELKRRLRGPAGLLLGAVLLAMLLRGLLSQHFFPPGSHSEGWLTAIGVAAIALVIAGWLLRRRASSLLFALVLTELTLLSWQLHEAVPSQPIDLIHRADAADLDLLREGFLDITDLTELSVFDEDVIDPAEDRRPAMEQRLPRTARDVLSRRWPVHLGLAHGIPALAGHARIAPDRAIAPLGPLVEALAVDAEGGDYRRLEQVDPRRVERWIFGPGGIGRRVLRLYGIPVVVGRSGVVTRVEGVAPRCWSPTTWEVAGDPDSLFHTIISTPFHTDGPALLEEALPGTGRRPPKNLTCKDDLSLQLESNEPSLIVLLRRHHPGWRVHDSEGRELQTFPVDLLHTGLDMPAGKHSLTLRFMPPGLQQGRVASLTAWLLLLSGAAWSFRQRRVQA